MDTTDRLAAAYGRFVAELEEAATESDLNQRALDAYSVYASLLADVWKEPVAEETTRAFEAYQGVISGGFRGPEAGHRIRAAYHNYLEELKAACAETDLTALAPSDLAAIGQSLSSLAWLVETGLEGEGTNPEETGDDAFAEEQGSSLWGSTSLLSNPSRLNGQS